MEHKHHSTSNTPEVFDSFMRCKFVGHYEVLASGHDDTKRVLVCECGAGLALSSTGAYWTEGAKDVAMAVEELRKTWERVNVEARRLAEMASALPTRSAEGG